MENPREGKKGNKVVGPNYLSCIRDTFNSLFLADRFTTTFKVSFYKNKIISLLHNKKRNKNYRIMLPLFTETECRKIGPYQIVIVMYSI